MSYETVIWEQSGAVGRLTLNRPQTLNAWTAQFGSELKQVVEGEAAKDSVPLRRGITASGGRIADSIWSVGRRGRCNRNVRRRFGIFVQDETFRV